MIDDLHVYLAIFFLHRMHTREVIRYTKGRLLERIYSGHEASLQTRFGETFVALVARGA